MLLSISLTVTLSTKHKNVTARRVKLFLWPQVNIGLSWCCAISQ